MLEKRFFGGGKDLDKSSAQKPKYGMWMWRINVPERLIGLGLFSFGSPDMTSEHVSHRIYGDLSPRNFRVTLQSHWPSFISVPLCTANSIMRAVHYRAPRILIGKKSRVIWFALFRFLQQLIKSRFERRVYMHFVAFPYFSCKAYFLKIYSSPPCRSFSSHLGRFTSRRLDRVDRLKKSASREDEVKFST